ncbi:MAG: hypothetical protein SFW09_13935 [Hyphomicrobiaceae bacterium]|nr:hypothetical protein [Hyphomicrobiaceae bacterium]
MAALFEPKLSTYILHFLRDHALSWETVEGILAHLAQEKARSPALRGMHRVSRLGVEDELKALVAAGLVRRRRGFGLGADKYRLSPTFTTLQKLVGFGLDGILTARSTTIAVNPVFGSASDVPLDVFVVMPFDPAMVGVYEPIRQVCTSLGLKAARADDLFTANHVMSDIWSSIMCARAVIADCTSRNPNVFYELGVAHTIGRPVILMTQDANDVPFDLKHMRYILYTDSDAGRDDLQEKLRKSLRETLGLDAG